MTSLRQEVLKQDPAQPTHSLVTMNALVSETIAAEKFYMIILGTFAAIALALAGAGVFGVLSYTVTARTQEIGLRMALGATRSNILGSILAHGVGLGLLGTAIGLVGAIVSTRAVATVLFNVSATDTVTFVAVGLVLLLVALAACAVPALRASRVDPIVALREE